MRNFLSWSKIGVAFVFSAANFSGGDIVLGAATVILAMGQGRTAAAAAAINEYLKTK